MRRATKHLLEKACDALILTIELFNRPSDRGRVSGVLIQFDHGFEMLMKAAILHRGGSIQDTSDRDTIGFKKCVGRSLNDGRVKYITEDQALILRTINSLRDSAQHYLVDISEGQFYIHIQAGITIFGEILTTVFEKRISDILPARVMPVSTEIPTDMLTIFETEMSEIRKLLQPGKRMKLEAMAKIRPLMILDSHIRGSDSLPKDGELQETAEAIARGHDWNDIFKGVATINLTTEGSGMSLTLRLSKREGIPVRIVPEGTEGFPVAVRQVNELDKYKMGLNDLAHKLGITPPKTGAAIKHFNIKADEDCFKEIKIGKSIHPRYSPKALERISSGLKETSLESIWAKHQAEKKVERKGVSRSALSSG